MGTTLQHGIFLPAEGERNCYAGLASNWTIIDGVVGGYSSHAANLTIHVTAADKEAWNGKADASALTAHTGNTTIHVTAADKEAWNGKADASALTAHTGNTTIHVTAADKEAWNGKADASALTAHTGNTTIHVTAEDKNKWDAVTSKANTSALTAHTGDTTIHVTAEDKTKWDAVTTKANDADVVHTSGNETIAGTKTFSGNISIYNSDTSVDTKYLVLRNQKVKRGSTTGTGGVQLITFHDKDGGTLVSYETTVLGSGNTQAYINVSNLDANSQRVVGGVKVIKTPTETWFIPDNDNTVSSGLSNYKWKDVQTKLINGLTPSSLGMPTDNASNIIDISGYLTVLDGSSANTYQAPDNGYIGITMSNCTGIQAYITGLWGHQIVRPTAGGVRFFMPICKNMTANILVFGGTVANARFFPCQGNI